MRVIFAGGGTGGHVYPGLSVAEALRAMRPDVEALYAGTGDAQEARIVRGAGLRYAGVRAAGIRARSLLQSLRGVMTIAAGVGQALRLLGRFKPDAVFATGGYGSVPLALAAALRRVPLVVFLPDVYPGWAVRLTARLARRLATSTEAALEFLPHAKTSVTGYPVRPAFFQTDRHQGRERMGLPSRLPVLLVTGGSTGAVALNTAFARHLPQFTTLAHVVHLTGRRDEARMLRYRERLTAHQQARYHVYGYLDDMPAAMASADLAVTRAGASTLGELPAVGLPAVLVPLELSDQARNARFLESQGAAVTITNADAPARLYAAVDTILKDPERLAAMRRAMTALAKPDAARDLARLVIEAVGIGGMHMSAIAQILLADGVRVTGSDQARSAMTERLAALGARVQYGHAAEHVGTAGLVVATAAAKADNPELREAVRRGIPVISRAQMVARLMEGRTGVCVAGTHGKTTTSTMITWMLRQTGRDPTFLLGGESLDLGTNAAPGTGAEIVVEADEYARAFLEYRPRVAVVTNVEADHLEYYGSVDAYEDAFRQFMRRVLPDGVIIACADSPRLAVLAAERYPARIERYGVARMGAAVSAPAPDWSAMDEGQGPLGGHDFTLLQGDRPLGRFSLRIPGVHMVANAAGAVAAGSALGLEIEAMRAALTGFRGAHRRFEIVGEAGGVTVVDDFAHHPTEIRVNIAAARERFPGRRLVVIFQPHTYSRTAYLLDEFRGCFVHADQLFVLETYASRETPDAGVSAQDLAEAVTAPPCEYVRTAEDAADRLRTELRSGDILVTIGAGDIDRVGRAVLEGLRAT